MFLQIFLSWVNRCSGMSWENVRLAEFFPVSGEKYCSFLPKFFADSSDQTTPSQLWLKTFLNVFRDRQNSLSWAASPTRLPCTSAGGAGTKSIGQETRSTGNLNVLLSKFGWEPFYSSVFHWCIYLNALRTGALSQQGFAECLAGGILTLFGAFCFLRMK